MNSCPPAAGTSAGATDLGAVGAWAVTLGLLMATALLPLRLVGIDAFGSSPVATAATLLIAYSPSLAALVVAAWWPGGGGVRRLLGQALRWRVSVGWYALALAGPIALVLAAVRIQTALGGTPPDHVIDVSPGLLLGVVGSLVAGALGEELGWRGLAQPTLERVWGFLPAALAVGLLWATWHQWPALLPGGVASWQDVATGYVRLVSTAVVYAWLYRATGGSLLLVMLAHTGHNIAVAIVGGASGAALPTAALYLAAAVAAVIASSPAGEGPQAGHRERRGTRAGVQHVDE